MHFVESEVLFTIGTLRIIKSHKKSHVIGS